MPAASLAEEMETEGKGRIRALVTVATNPVRSYPNSERLDKAFAELDFFVAFDIYVNETTRHADVILPAPSALEEEAYELFFMANAVRSFGKFGKPIFDGEGPSEADIFARLILVLRGEGAAADPAIVHDELLNEAVERLLDPERGQTTDLGRDEIMAALKELSPVEKLLDLKLRTGWQGDLFGRRPGGTSLGKLTEHPHGVDFG
jgi:anaerobic selenocysteine-containing dehydrogenase